MRPGFVVITLAIFTGFGLAGCGSDNIVEMQPASQSVQPGKYVFAVRFDNYAFTKKNRGLVIKGNGDLYTYNISATNAALTEKELTDETELTRYFEAATFQFVRALSKEELDQLWRDSLSINNSTLGTRTNICYDAGSYQYLMFQPTTAQQIKKVQIYQAGDFRQEQLDPKAAFVKAYLLKLALELQIAYKLDPDGNNWCSGM